MGLGGPGSSPQPGAGVRPPAKGLVKGLEPLLALVQSAKASEAAGDLWWPAGLWGQVALLARKGELDAGLLAVLEGHGFGGGSPERARPPQLLMLEQALSSFRGPLPEGLPADAAVAAAKAGRYSQGLPADLKRAAPEIYRSLREANVSVRDWLQQYFQGNRRASQWVDLWAAATAVDLRLQQAEALAGWVGVQEVLMTDDLVEIHLRRLSSYVHGTRTGDWSGANFMLAMQAPGSEIDIAPTWLISDATAYSKSEHQRGERVGRSGKSDAEPRGKGRGKSKGGGAWGGSPGPAA